MTKLHFYYATILYEYKKNIIYNIMEIARKNELKWFELRNLGIFLVRIGVQQTLNNRIQFISECFK